MVFELALVLEMGGGGVAADCWAESWRADDAAFSAFGTKARLR